MKTTDYRHEEYISNENWPWVYTQNLFDHPTQKHIPQEIITRKSIKDPFPQQVIRLQIRRES